MNVEFNVKKMNQDKPKIKRIELEYKDMNYIIINLEEQVIDVNGNLWEYSNNSKTNEINNIVWSFKNLIESDYWPDETVDDSPKSTLWRLAWYDEFDRYYHKSGTTKYPDNFMNLVNILKNLK